MSKIIDREITEEYMDTEVPLELRGSVNNNSVYPNHTSPSRGVMFTSHYGQHLEASGVTPRSQFTGGEVESGKYLLEVKAPCDMTVYCSIRRRARSLVEGGIKMSPSIALIYQDRKTGEYGVVEIKKYQKLHKYIGYTLEYVPGLEAMLRPGAHIAEGTVLAGTHARNKETGEYMYGVEVPMCTLSFRSVAEDGFIFSDEIMKEFTFTKITSVDISWGKDSYPKQLPGQSSFYKIFPEVGERIPESGIIMATGKHNPDTEALDLLPWSLATVDETYDRVYRGPAGARIIDVDVLSGIKATTGKGSNVNTPVGMEEQTQRYVQSDATYYGSVLEAYERMKRTYGNKLKITPELQRLIVRAMADFKPRGCGDVKTIVKADNDGPIDEWRVRITYEEVITPTYRHKYADTNGGKGVCCGIWPVANMPIDEAGNRAHIIREGVAGINRANPSGNIEQYVSASMRDFYRTVTTDTPEEVEHHWARNLEYMKYLSPRQHKVYTTLEYTHEERKAELDSQRKFPRVDMQDTAHLMTNIRDHLQPRWPVVKSRVRFVDELGRNRISESPVLIANVYVMILDKLGDSASAVGMPKLQVHGYPGKLTPGDAHTSPFREKATRITGEDEVRLFSSTQGPLNTAKFMQMNCSVQVYTNTIRELMGSPVQPYETEPVPRAVEITRHLTSCLGFKIHDIRRIK